MSTKDDREKHLISNILSTSEDSSAIIMSSPCDLGVRRNFGRAGSRFAPKVILNTIKKFNNHFSSTFSIGAINVSQINDSSDFDQLQINESNQIKNIIEQKDKKFIHIGGGHDHVYPLLRAIEKTQQYQNLIIINIDAHCDTRVDSISHSGTPFRDFDKNTKLPFYLFQYGIHLETNNKETISDLKNGIMHLSAKQQSVEEVIQSIRTNCPFEISDKTLLLISIDCDGFDASFMSAVSAVNLNGISLDHYLELQEELKTLCSKSILGIYEYNPLFEDLSLKGAKAISKIITDYLK